MQTRLQLEYIFVKPMGVNACRLMWVTNLCSLPVSSIFVRSALQKWTKRYITLVDTNIVKVGEGLAQEASRRGAVHLMKKWKKIDTQKTKKPINSSVAPK